MEQLTGSNLSKNYLKKSTLLETIKPWNVWRSSVRQGCIQILVTPIREDETQLKMLKRVLVFYSWMQCTTRSKYRPQLPCRVAFSPNGSSDGASVLTSCTSYAYDGMHCEVQLVRYTAAAAAVSDIECTMHMALVTARRHWTGIHIPSSWHWIAVDKFD